METMYQGGTISANDKMAVITFRPGWGDPGDWDIDFYREKTPCASLSLREEETTYKDIITLGLEFTGYDDAALERDMAFVTASRGKIQKESDYLSTLCAQNLPFESIISQLRGINIVAGGLSEHCSRIETHMAVYKAAKQDAKGL